MKFESGTGWPSFNVPVEGSVETHDRPQLGHDADRGALRRPAAAISATSSRTARRRRGLRYCINGVALEFRPGLIVNAPLRMPALGTPGRSR